MTMLTNGNPMNADRPTPNKDSANPVATWLAISDSASTAKTTDNAAAPIIPASTPSHGWPVFAATMNETTAPASIIPSTPRLSTPDFSTTSSPSAANTSGVPAASVSATRVARCSNGKRYAAAGAVGSATRAAARRTMRTR